jgi:polysaccharide pyruvyl transferase WcaK-like protein
MVKDPMHPPPPRAPTPAPTPALTLGLLWHSATSDNLGVGALTVAQIAIAEAQAAERGLAPSFVILGWKDPRQSYVTAANVSRADLRTRDLIRPSGLWAAVRRCDIVLDIGAGDSFSDIYGAKRFLKYMLAKAVVHLARRPLVVSPQTIGPFAATWARILAFASLRRSAAIFARDQLSVDFLREAGFGGTVTLASDVALKLPYAPPAPRPPGGPVRVGINVSGLLMNGGYTGANMFGLALDYPRMMRRLIAAFALKPGCEVHLVAHVISDHIAIEDDYRAGQALAAEIGAATGARIVLAPKFASPSEAKTYIASLDFFTGSRMHACIAAFSSGVAMLPIAYSRKFAGLFDALGYAHTLDCRSQAAEDIEARVMAGFEARETLRAEAATALALGLDRLAVYEAALGGLMGRMAGP